MSDFETALRRIRKHGEGILDDAAEMLRQLVRDTSDAIHASEGSILVPSEDETELRFLVSMNPALDPSDIRVPVDGSVSGYVFSSRQAMAKIHPDSIGVSKVDEAAKLTTKYLLAVPIVDDDRVYGVATFVNRAEGHADEPFSIDELKMAQGFGEIYATGMKLYRKIEFSTSVAELEIREHACEFGLDGLEENSGARGVAAKYRLPALLAEKSLTLPEREREMLYRMADLLGEYAERTDVEEDYDL
ncbi:MAG: GAF domain-containing protein [Verrucomicrobiales bacterium]|nr:GAF domain-containing protein [Verrucomicrobiales bacterium]